MIEALAAGLPIVASDVPACREVLEDGRFGKLVQQGSPQALADGILEATKNPDVNVDERLEYARGFTPIKMMDQYLEIATAKK